jgi:hypothetical protein
MMDWVLFFLIICSIALLIIIFMRTTQALREIATDAHARTITCLHEDIMDLRRLIIRLDQKARAECARYALDVSNVMPVYSDNGPSTKELDQQAADFIAND